MEKIDKKTGVIDKDGKIITLLAFQKEYKITKSYVSSKIKGDVAGVKKPYFKISTPLIYLIDSVYLNDTSLTFPALSPQGVFRTQAEQQALYAAGKTSVKNAGVHNLGMAIDLNFASGQGSKWGANTQNYAQKLWTLLTAVSKELKIPIRIGLYKWGYHVDVAPYYFGKGGPFASTDLYDFSSFKGLTTTFGQSLVYIGTPGRISLPWETAKSLKW